MKNNRMAFTMIELIMTIVIIGILAAVAVPRFINMRRDAANAAAEANIAAMRSSAGIYYGQSATPAYANLCTACPTSCSSAPPYAFHSGDSCNCFRSVTVASGSCFPATTAELENLLNSGIGLTWPTANATAACYNSATGAVSSCM
jgi:prepilin-type N-terminal cleavage/methylation domain-containing protein